MKNKFKIKKMILIILSAIGLAMGVSVVVLSKLNEMDIQASHDLLGLGIACVSLSVLMKNEN